MLVAGLACDGDDGAPDPTPTLDETPKAAAETEPTSLKAAFDPAEAITPLQFEQVGSFPYPVGTTGVGTGMTVGRLGADPHLFIVTQTLFSDPIVALNLDTGDEQLRYDSPPGQDTIVGLAYDWNADTLWASQGLNQATTMVEIDPETGVQLNAVTVPQPGGNALAFNGASLLRGYSHPLLGPRETQLDLLTQGGAVLNSAVIPDITLEGLSIAPLSYLASDTENDTVWLTTLWFRTYASFVPPGSPSATRAIAWDTERDYDYIAQLPSPNGTVGAVGTPYHPDTPWSPAPFGGRHRIYLANEADQTIDFGYLTL